MRLLSTSIQVIANINTSTQYTLSLLVFVAKNINLFLSNCEIHNLNTRCNYNLHLLPTTNLT